MIRNNRIGKCVFSGHVEISKKKCMSQSRTNAIYHGLFVFNDLSGALLVVLFRVTSTYSVNLEKNHVFLCQYNWYIYILTLSGAGNMKACFPKLTIFLDKRKEQICNQTRKWILKNTEGQSRMYNPEKLAPQDEKQTTAHYVLDTIIRRQTQITTGDQDELIIVLMRNRNGKYFSHITGWRQHYLYGFIGLHWLHTTTSQLKVNCRVVIPVYTQTVLTTEFYYVSCNCIRELFIEA